MGFGDVECPSQKKGMGAIRFQTRSFASVPGNLSLVLLRVVLGSSGNG